MQKKSLCESLVLSHFNYCDCLFPSLTKSLVDKIQKVQNACVRFIYNLRKYDRDHISPFLKKLGWMNMFNRRLLHSYTLMFKIDKNLAPQYLADLVPRSRNIHNHNTREKKFREWTLPLNRCHFYLRTGFDLGAGLSGFYRRQTII